ncbi:ABC transporter ATP-binding protein [Pseudonocardia sp. N23]|uniref:ABC transporter ATP-binding protein n=1 Tax=Pseudonocardia sp. N23 TaxID=1987376 RepID=UPI000BFC6C87|nr:ATP-binding cassette domain-containing protein [Pseudonocardia sp. N23]GAY08885.1 nitrate transport ATP-binding subunits C and D [Pseudonocardia sp. N23]
MGTVALRLTGATKRYGAAAVLDGVDLDVERDSRLVVLGHSGSGKSTLLRVLAGLEELDSGSLTRPDAADGRGAVVGTVFQQPLLLPWLTVRENIALGGRYRANKARFDTAHVEELIDLFGLRPQADSLPSALSGGQAQRVSIARVVAVRPDILLLDEPFSALDPATRRSLQVWLRETAAALGLTLVMVTHDVDEALYLATEVTLLDGSGRAAGHWSSDAPVDHDDLAGHSLRATLLAGYRSQLGAAAAS